MPEAQSPSSQHRRFVVSIDIEALTTIGFYELGVEPERIKTMGDAASVLQMFLCKVIEEHTGYTPENGEVVVQPVPTK